MPFIRNMLAGQKMTVGDTTISFTTSVKIIIHSPTTITVRSSTDRVIHHKERPNDPPRQ